MTRQKGLKTVAAMTASLVVYSLIGFYLLPMLALAKLPAVLSQQLGRSVQIEAIRFNPFGFSLALNGFVLPSTDGKNMLSFDSLSVDVELLESLLARGIVLDSVEWLQPQLNIERRSDGQFNFTELLPQSKTPESAQTEAGVPLLIHQLSVNQGKIDWFEAGLGPTALETLLPVNLKLEELSTQLATDAHGQLNVGLASGGSVEWQGDLTLTPLRSQGKLKITNLALPKLWQLFLSKALPVSIVQGLANLQTDYVFGDAPSGLNTRLSQASIEIKQLEIVDTAQQPLIGLPVLAVQGIELDLDKQQLSIASVSAQDAALKASLQADGVINYQALLMPAASAAPVPQVDTEPVKPWQINLDELALNHFKLSFTDFSLPKPVTLSFTELNCKLQGFTNQGNPKMPLLFSSVFNDYGKININGDMSLQPFSANLSLVSNDINLKVFQGYLDRYLNLELFDGDFNADGKLQLVSGDELQIKYQGNAGIVGLIVRDRLKNKDFLKWADFQISGMDIDVAKQNYKLDKVVFDRPYVRFNIKKDGTTNVDELILPQPTANATAKPATVTANTAKPSLSIGSISMKNGKSDFADYSLILPFVAEMNQLNGEVSGFSSDKDEYAKLAVQGKVYDLALVNIKGQYQFQNGDSDIGLNFTHMPLPLITPYMAEFAGYRIEKGQMALDLQYKIKQGQLEVQNKLVIDQLALGEHVDNPHASSLPLHLAIALLKDADGKIKLDFPITGSLDDPNISIGSLLVDVLTNLVTKVAASPFQALSGLLGEDKDFSVIRFAPGRAELDEQESAKLALLGKALMSKPELTLEIKGVAYENQDWPAMRFDSVVDVLKKMKSGELRDKGQKIRHEYIELSDAEYKRLLAKFFGEVFPNELTHSLLGAPQIKTEPNADFYGIAKQRLEGIFQPEAQRLNDLAVSRANHIAQYMIQPGGVSRDRVYILATELNQTTTVDGIHSILSLNALP